MKKVLIGFLGSTLDKGLGKNRWDAWRPSVSLFQQEDLLFDRLDLIYQIQYKNLLTIVVEDIRLVSPETTIRTHEMQLQDAWDFQEVYSSMHDFARNYHFDTDKEEYYFHISTGTHVMQICSFLLTESRHFPARLIQSSPPNRHHPEEPGTYVLIDLDLSKYDRIAQRYYEERSESQKFLKSGIETRDPHFNQLIEQIEHVAIHSKNPILLYGTTGSGKTLLARRIYELKNRRRQIKGRFVEVNCATLRGDAAMSALFGHKKGAFTGAIQDREGLLRQADEGVLFLDEIGELGIDEQTMLLRAIEDHCFIPLGADTEKRSQFQLICGTNRDLRDAVRQGTFRDDLLARINLWIFQLPSLAQRRADIAPNIQYELDQLTQREGKTIRFNKEALHLYLRFAESKEARWLYNFRDLSGSIARMATMSPSGRITEQVVHDEILRLKANWHEPSPNPAWDMASSLLGVERWNQLDRFDQAQLADVITVCRQSKSLSEAGRTLFSQSRQDRRSANDSDRLRKYLAKLDLSWEQITS
jgi:transcriptional regulatory protein RtcR